MTSGYKVAKKLFFYKIATIQFWRQLKIPLSKADWKILSSVPNKLQYEKQIHGNITLCTNELRTWIEWLKFRKLSPSKF